MRYQNNSHQTLKAAVSFSLIALVSGFILNGASITFTSNGPQYTKPQPLVQHLNTTPSSQPTSTNNTLDIPLEEKGVTSNTSAVAQLSSEEQQRKHAIRQKVTAQYKKARNMYLADPTINTNDKSLLISQLDSAIYGETQEAPAMTPQDLAEQARYKKIISNFQQNTQSLKTNTSLTRQQKELEIRRLLGDFIQEAEG